MSRSVVPVAFAAAFVCGAHAAGGYHKVVAPPGLVDEKAPGVRLIADYGSYRLYRIEAAAFDGLPARVRAGAALADDMDVIRLDAAPLNTRGPVAEPPARLTAPPFAGRTLQIVQFVGPIKQEWLDALAASGVRPVQYIERNAYLVWADAAGRQALDAMIASGAFLQYSGPDHPYYKLGPTLREPLSAPVAVDRAVPVTVQILDHDGSAETERCIEAASLSVDSTWQPVLAFRDAALTIPLSRLAEIAALPDVTWVGERLPVTMNDEVQTQIVAGHLDPTRSGPSAPGYKAFLDAKGFPNDPGAYPILNLSDDGAGNGSIAAGAGDPVFTRLGDGLTSRIAFLQNCTNNPAGNGVGGHGHLNMGIAGGYDARPGDPYRDPEGFQRGLGVNPYGRLAMTKIFLNTGGYDTSKCGGTDGGVIAASYAAGARISSNSWGCAGCGVTYDTSSQAYDAGTRDAQPAVAGNQQMFFVFSAGNSGPGAESIGTPGNAKNVLTVGASENDRPGWFDGCGIGSSGADDAMDIIGFSSRGPAPGGRVKPDVVAPGTHVQGTASTDPAYDGSGVCDRYLPFPQTIFAASSGTSHAAPAVAGATSLYARWLVDHGLAANPSPALLKAYTLAHTAYLNGASAADTLPSNAQGYGMPDLELAFDDTPRYVLDQSVVLGASGDTWMFQGSVADASKPVRIVLVYTDAPGAVGTSPQVNDLNLRATVGGATYKGNVFTGATSVSGGAADAANNAEAIFLPTGTTGSVVVNVDGFNVAGDGVPNSGDGTDQDFALVCYNCATCAATIVTDRTAYSCNASIAITLGDSDEAGRGTRVVTVRSDVETAPESVTLVEFPAESGVFVGSVATLPAAPAHGDGAISVAHGGTVTIGYVDASACGTPNVAVERSLPVDCRAPVITNVRAASITGDGAELRWDTDEPANARATYGPAPAPPSTATPLLPAPTASHVVALDGLAACSSYVYSVTSTDAAGNAATDDAGGAFHAFSTVANVQMTYTYAGPPVPIPDNSPVGASASIVVPDEKTIVDVDVTVDSLTHTYDGDLVLYLVAPDDTYVVLASARGRAGDNFRGTVFDDSAAAAIATGVAPFTGPFRPETPLSTFDGRIAAGDWTLFVVDQAGQDVGTIDRFTVRFTYPVQSCGPHAAYRSNATVSDECPTGGGGDNALWEPGEQVRFKVELDNDGTVALTGVTATIASLTPGVNVVDGAAGYPDVPSFTQADSLDPDFTVTLDRDLFCGTAASFQLTVRSQQGTWTTAFDKTLGDADPGTRTPLKESFLSGIPATWTVVNGGQGGGAAATWTTANPGGRTFAAPLLAPVAIVDSDAARNLATQDEELITPPMDLGGAATAVVDFDQFFDVYIGGLAEIADVDVRSSRTGGLWVNVLRQQGVSSPEPDHKTVDITGPAAGATNVQVRFHYYQAQFEFFWQIDNVVVSTTAPPTCAMTVCPATPPAANPVPDGAFGSAMTASRANAAGSAIDLAWDTFTCPSTGYHVLYGDLASVATAVPSGAACAIGTTGGYAWTGVPAGSVWFLVVGDDGAAMEGSWGDAAPGAPRGGASPSGRCGLTSRDNAATCGDAQPL